MIKNRYSNKKGVTLIELVIFIIVVAIISSPLYVIVREAMSKTALPEYFNISSSLARKEVENTTNQQFSTIIDIGETSYTGNFSQYSYEISVDYVNDSDLNTSVDPAVTDYKRVEIIIRKTGFPDVSVVTLVTNN